MRIIASNMCSECTYCIEDYDNNGLCCKDNIYTHVKLNQSACRSFCSDDENNEQHNTCISNPYQYRELDDECNELQDWDNDMD